MLFATDADHIVQLQAKADAAEADHDAACAAFRRAAERVGRSRSEKNRRAYINAGHAVDEACAAAIAARVKLERAQARAERRMTQAIKAARRVAQGVQLQLAL